VNPDPARADTPANPAEPERIWGGTTLADRRATRRRQLLDAGLDLLGGEGGSAAVAVRAVCRRSRLTERYFYESFPDRDALVLAVYEEVAQEAHATLEEATARGDGDPAKAARAAIEAMVELMVDDPRKGRVLLVAPVTEPVLASRTMELAPGITRMIRDQLSSDVSDTDRDLIATGALGALMALFHSYLQGTVRVGRDEFVAHCVRLLLTVNRLET
jgi:AcrR family transcriptional regulator